MASRRWTNERRTTKSMSNDKTIHGWLVVDWKEESHRTRKNKPGASELGTNELLAELEVNVSVPDVEVPTLAVNIDVPEPQVFAATLEALDDDELPDWSDVANEQVHQERLAFKNAANAQEFGNVVDQVTTRVLMEVNSRPDPANVREYVERVARETLQEEDDREGAVETEAGP